MTGVALCECGCGQPAPIMPYSNRSRGFVKGQPFRFVRGHNALGRLKRNRWIEEDRGHDTPCWTWQMSKTPQGYGHQWHKDRHRGAHIVLYEQHRGLVPEGLELDHLCRNRDCVNPGHLEAVTHAENVRRGALARREAA